LIGGEESGGVGISRHLPERDGLLNSLLLANVMADEKKTLGELVAALQAEFGEHQYGRIDMHIEEEREAGGDCAGAGVERGRHHGGDEGAAGGDDGWDQVLSGECGVRGKENAAETWLLLRASGTEPLLRVYCESCSVESVGKVLDAAREFVLEG
jgi:phosphomannomutase